MVAEAKQMQAKRADEATARKDADQGAGQERPRDLTIGRDGYKPRETTNNDWVVRVGDHIKEADLTNPALWTNAPLGLQQFDILRVVGPRLWAEVLVRKYIGGDVAQMLVLRAIELPEALESNEDREPDGYKIFHDDVYGWSIRRLSDGEVIADRRTKPQWHARRDALRWLQDSAPVRQR